VDDDRHAVLRELDVELEHGALALPRVPERRHRLLREGRDACEHRAAPVRVDRGRGGRDAVGEQRERDGQGESCHAHGPAG
jgi:hypothetical protein